MLTTESTAQAPAIKLLAVIEATTVNAVAKNMLEFQRSALELSRQSPDSVKVETSFVTFDRDRMGDMNEFVRAMRERGLEIDVIPESRRFDLRVIRALRRIVKRRSPDIILTHQVKSHFLIRLSRLWREYPWVAFHHGYTATDRKMRAYNYLDRWSLPAARRVVTVCQAFARELTHSGGVAANRINVQHNSIRPEQPVSVEEIEALKTRLGITREERVLLAVGRLSSEKAHADLLQAVSLLPEVAPGISARLVIVGDGPERGRLEEAVASLGLVDRVTFIGQVSDVRPYYAAADALVLPSHTEGSPYVLLEAMAAGLPVVATAVGGIPEMVEDETSALLVAPRDARLMAWAIARILTDDELAQRLAMNASALAATRYSPEAYFRSLVEIYRGLIKDMKSRGN